jgi:hypothetical protein
MVNHLVHCLVDGLPFLGEYRTTPVTGRVGLFNYEVTPSQYRRWFRDVGMKRPDRVAMLHLRGLRLPIVVRDIEKYVIDWLKRHEIEVWILDPFARALVGSGDENDNTEVGRFLDTLDVIKEQSGVTELLMPTHTGRAEFEPGKERARGATRLDDWPDVRWVLVKGDEDRRYLTCSGRDVDEAEMGLAYDTTTRGLTVAGAGRATTKRSGLRGELFAYIQTNPGLGVNELYDAFPNRKRELVAALHELTASGAVEVRQGPKRKHLHFARSQPPANDAPWMERDPGAGLF